VGGQYILSGRLHLTIKHTGIHNMAKCAGEKLSIKGARSARIASGD